MFEMFSNASIAGKLSLVVVLGPMIVGILYAIRPTEARLALMRPISLAGIFAGLGGFCVSVINVLAYVSQSGHTWADRVVALGLAEAFVPPFVACGCLTVGWLCVALGFRRQSARAL